MSKEKNIPRLRFPGFTDAWEQRKFDEWGDFYYGHSCPKWSVTEDATIPCIRYGELYTKFGAKIDRVYSYTNMPPEKLRFSKGTEVLIPRVGEDPMDYNHCTWLSLKDVAIGEMISVFNTDQDPLFSATMFNATLQKEFAVRVEGGSVTNLYFDKLRNIDISYPSMQEQKKIAAFFGNLDNLITLHQRKSEALSEYKNGMLQKMFPRDGMRVPEVRFPGFTDPWEQRKLGESLSFLKDGTHGTHADADDGPLLLSAKNIKDGTIKWDETDRRISLKEYEKIHSNFSLKTGDILLTIVGSIGETAILKDSEGLTFQRSVAFLRPTEDILSDFLYTEIQTPSFQKELDSRKSTSAQPGIYLGDLAEIPVRYSSSLEEQSKIGEYFLNLDNLITLHQRECEALREYKKGLLQQMFV